MPRHTQVPLPESDDPETLKSEIRRWAASEPMRELVERFGGALPDGGTADLLDRLEAFSALHWDFRAGRERFETDPKRFDPLEERAMCEAALALGLGGRHLPRRTHYTHFLVLGGLLSSCLFRTRFAAELLAGGITTEHVTGAGSFRPFNDRDHRLATLTGTTGGRFEVDAVEAGLARAFDLDRPPRVQAGGDPERDPGRAWKIAAHTTGPMTVQAVAAPSTEPDRRRADTADTCRFWADRVAELAPGQTVLVVTSAIFVPFQHADALACLGLPYGCAVETVGVDTTALPETYFRKDYTAGDYLQEIRSTIRSMRRLHRLAHPR